MIILDTNVVSELLRPVPEPKVKDWFEGQDRKSTYLTVLSEVELRLGVEIMPAGKRRDAMESTMEAMVILYFQNRILSFDRDAAWKYVQIAARLRKIGRPTDRFDCQIAAIASAHGAKVATRNVRHFEGCGLSLINPWNQ